MVCSSPSVRSPGPIYVKRFLIAVEGVRPLLPHPGRSLSPQGIHYIQHTSDTLRAPPHSTMDLSPKDLRNLSESATEVRHHPKHPMDINPPPE